MAVSATTLLRYLRRISRNWIFSPDIFLVELNIEGEEMRCIVQDIQFHPVTDRILHIDFLQVFPDKPIVIEVQRCLMVLL